MSVQMDETFATALRDLLVERVQSTRTASRWSHLPRQWIAGPRRWVTAAGAVLVLAAAGGGIAYATGAFTTQPGGDAVTELASPVTTIGTGTQTVELGSPPAGTTAISIAFTCLTAGEFTFDDGASASCDRPDAARQPAPLVTYTLPVSPGQHTTTITATPGARWRLVATYVSVTTTAWGANASGQTYGVQNQHGTPDLVAVMATNHRTGYVYATQLNPPAPKTIAQALAENNAPPKTLTVYENDGRTPIGKFVISRPTGVDRLGKPAP